MKTSKKSLRYAKPALTMREVHSLIEVDHPERCS